MRRKKDRILRIFTSNFKGVCRIQNKIIVFNRKLRANLSKQNVDVTLTLVNVYRIFQNFQALTLESVSFKSRNVDVTSTFANVDPSILLVDV